MSAKSDFAAMEKVMKAWYSGLAPLAMDKVIVDEESAKHTYVFSADMINGFCREGDLASPRIDALTQPVVKLFIRAHESGVTNFVLVQDCHDAHAKEFDEFPPHAIRGTAEAETLPELMDLPFSDKFVIFLKNTLSPAWAYREKQHEPPPHTHPIYPKNFSPVFKESFEKYIETQDIRTAIVVGNCTDLCVRELAMYIKMWANQHQKDMRIIIPENCVETFDLLNGEMPHHGNFFNQLTLHEMARNGIEVVKEVV